MVKLLRYLVALLLVLAGACVMGYHIGAALSGADLATIEIADMVKLAVADATNSPVWHLGLGAGLAVVGLLVAAPVVTISFGVRKPREEKRSARALVHDLGSPDAKKRLSAARELSALAEASTIPAFIKALRDSNSKVRGQACEGLLNITGIDFDFVDVAGESVREEAVQKWEVWWKQNKSQIIAGTDPKSIGEGNVTAAVESAPAPAPRKPTRRQPGRGTSITRAIKRTGGSGRVTPRPSAGAQGAKVGRTSPAPKRTTPAPKRTTPAPKRTSPVPGKKEEKTESGRHLSIGELVRRKRQKEDMEAAPPGGGKWVGDEEPKPSAAPPAKADEPVFGGDVGTPLPEGGGDTELPSPDDELPSPDGDLPPPPP